MYLKIFVMNYNFPGFYESNFNIVPEVCENYLIVRLEIATIHDMITSNTHCFNNYSQLEINLMIFHMCVYVNTCTHSYTQSKLLF